MLTIRSLPDCFPAELSSIRMPLTEDEQRQLMRVQAIAAAERHLVALDRPCVDHQACRRLAFALWALVGALLAMTPWCSTDSSQPKTSARTVVLLVELRCYLCANTVGVLEMRWQRLPR